MEAKVNDKPRARIGKKGPPLLVEVPHPDGTNRVVEHEALNPNPQRWFRIMERADYGDTGPMIDMFSDARDRDQHLDGVARKRAQSMMGRPIVFRPADGMESDQEALGIARKVRRVLLFESAKFRSMLTHLMQAPVDSYAVAPIRWTVNRDGWHIPHLQWAHSNRFCFDRNTLELSFYRSKYRVHHDVEPLCNHPDAFVAHVPIGGRSDYPWRRGAMRASIIPSFIKRNGLKFWMTLAERFGMPQLYAVVPEGEDNDDESADNLVRTTEAALKNINRIWSMVVSQGIEIHAIEGSTSNIDGKVHQQLISWANTVQSIGLLGQNLTTEVTGGSFAAAEAHRYVAADLHLADATELAETITQQLVEPVVRYNWPGAPVPVCEISTGAKQVFQVEDVREGIASPDERRRTLGHEALPNGQGAEVRGTQAQVPEDLAAPAANPEDPTAPTEVESVPTKIGGFELVGQITSLQAIVESVVAGTMPKDIAVRLIATSLPMTEAEATALFGDFGEEPAPAPEAPAAEPAAKTGNPGLQVAHRDPEE